MIHKPVKTNRQVQRTKSWIFEALMLLMDETQYSKITVSDICEKAGVARPTFYRNYREKDDIVFNYLENTFSTELPVGNENTDDKPDSIILLFDYGYMVQNRKNLKKILSIPDIENRIYRDVQKFPMSLIKHYRDKLTPEEYLICRYKLCYQITGSLRVIMEWFSNDMPLSAENVVYMLNAMNIPKTIQYRNIPSIVVRIKNED